MIPLAESESPLALAYASIHCNLYEIIESFGASASGTRFSNCIDSINPPRALLFTASFTLQNLVSLTGNKSLLALLRTESKTFLLGISRFYNVASGLRFRNLSTL